MYAKIFQSIFDGTLVEDWRALITFEQMLILSDADGIVDMTQHAIARRTGIPIEHIEAGIKFLEQPDPSSRTATAEGRRIIRLNESRNWGWQIVNHQTYRDMRTADDRREYMRQYMRDYRKDSSNQEQRKPGSLQQLTVNFSKTALGGLADTNTDTNTEADTKNRAPIVESEALDATSARSTSCPYDKLIGMYHEYCPTLAKIIKRTDTLESNMRQRWREHPHVDQWKQFFLIVSRSKFLMGKRQGRDGKKSFMADLRWLMKPENFAKVMEGKYDD